MGAALSKFWDRVTEFPIKRRPICFHLPKSFTSTGEEQAVDLDPTTDAYDELQNAFIGKLAEMKEINKNWIEDNFPYWNQFTTDNLHNSYMCLTSEENGLMDFPSFVRFLESIGDTSSIDYREEKFRRADTNEDGFINIDEFLVLVYSYHSLEETEDFKGVPVICFELGEQIRKVTYLSLSEQLENGLF